jgi:hypothetical protein
LTDQHSGPHDGSLPELTPEQESHVRRLLAEARHDEPMPTEVGERLDRVLAGLTRDDPGAPGVAPVIDLAARRRRRNAAAVLAGAAAVIVAGFAVGQVIDVGSNDAGSASSNSAADAERSTASDESARSPGVRGQGGQGVNPSESAPAPTSSATLLRLRSAHLQHDLRTQLGALQGASDSVRNHAEGFAALGCEPTPPSRFGLGELFPALYDDQPAVVALRPPAEGRQQADVLACDTAATLAITSLPAR